MSGTRVVIIAASGPGDGHTVRCAALGDALAARGADVESRVYRTDNFVVPSNAVWKTADLVVIDAPQLYSAIVTSLPAATHVAVIIDKWPWAGVADTVIHPHVAHAIGSKVMPSSPYDNTLIGPKYALLRQEFAIAKPIEIKPTVSRIAHYHGGNPPVQFGKIPEHIEVVVCPPGTLNTEEWITWLRSCDLAIMPPSMAALECLCLGIPTVCYASDDEQHRRMYAMSDLGLVAALSPRVSRGIAQALPLLRMLIQNHAARQALGKIGPQYVDGKGCDRVATILTQGLRVLTP